MKRLGAGQIILLATLSGIFMLTMVWAVHVWNASSDAPMDKHGWIALGLGTSFSLLIGCGLMALMFFSSRSGHDELADPFRPHPTDDNAAADTEQVARRSGSHDGAR
jgi:hypothetical protein